MKALLYALLFLFSIAGVSQTTIGPGAIVQLGEQEPTVFLDFSSQAWSSQTAGPAQNWNYASLVAGEVCDFHALDPMTSVYRDSFPDSDLYFICTFSDSNGNTSEEHTFYNIEGDVLQLAGNVSLSITNPSYDSIFIVYTDPLDWGTFPYMYEGTSDDSFEARVTSYIGAQVIVAIQTGTSTHEVESYGSLTTPAGTFEKTLRVKRVELAENSIPGFPISTPQESYRYTWYAENEKSTILNLDSIVIKDMNGGIVNTNFAGSYRQRGPTVLSNDLIELSDLSIYPNPTSDLLYVELPEEGKWKILLMDIRGQEIPIRFKPSSDNVAIIDLHGMPMSNGFYFMVMTNEESGRSQYRKVQVLR